MAIDVHVFLALVNGTGHWGLLSESKKAELKAHLLYIFFSGEWWPTMVVTCQRTFLLD